MNDFPHQRTRGRAKKAETTHSLYVVPTPVEYWLLTTFPRERWYRRWWIEMHPELSLIDSFTALAQKYPHGLSQIAELPEERSGEVSRAGLNPSNGAQKIGAPGAMMVRKATAAVEEATA